MRSRDAHLEYLRRELRMAELHERILHSEAAGSEMRRGLMARYGTAADQQRLAAAADRAAEPRARAIALNRQNQETWRRLIAEHLARAPETVQPVQARSDDEALFELLAGVGGRMPAGGGR